jgi:hypothetical protein
VEDRGQESGTARSKNSKFAYFALFGVRTACSFCVNLLQEIELLEQTIASFEERNNLLLEGELQVGCFFSVR